jgi:hypothetical protein
MGGPSQGLNCQKISGGGLTSAYSLSVSLHTGNSASLTTAGGVETDPPGYPRASCLGGLSKQLGGGGSTPNPPGNSNTGASMTSFAP